jgi:hypothetical protein
MAFGQDLYNAWYGGPGTFQQSPNKYNPLQQQIIQQAGQQGLQGIGTDAIEGAARRGYRQNTIPLLSERFANIGGRGLSGIGSSGYQNAISETGTNLETQLAALRQGNANSLLQLGLTPQTDTYFEEGSQGLQAPILEGLTRIGEAYFGGGGGQGIWDFFKSLFGGRGAAEEKEQQQPSADSYYAREQRARQQVNNMSPLQLANYAGAKKVESLPGYQGYTTGIQAPHLPNQVSLMNRLNGPNPLSAILELIGQANVAQGLPNAGRQQSELSGIGLQRRLAQPLPGFEL